MSKSDRKRAHREIIERRRKKLAREFFQAVWDSDLERTLDLIARGVDVDAVSSAGATALILAVKRGDSALVSALKRAGASTAVPEALQDPLAIAKAAGRDDLVAVLEGRHLPERASASRERASRRARERAGELWEKTSRTEWLCNRCNQPIRRGDGYLCVPEISGIVLPESGAGLDLSGCPDLICHECFESDRAARPFEGPIQPPAGERSETADFALPSDNGEESIRTNFVFQCNRPRGWDPSTGIQAEAFKRPFNMAMNSFVGRFGVPNNLAVEASRDSNVMFISFSVPVRGFEEGQEMKSYFDEALVRSGLRYDDDWK